MTVSPVITEDQNIASYVTPFELKRYLTETKNTRYPVQDDQQLRTFCLGASRLLEGECHRRFYPRREIRVYDNPTKRGSRVFTRTTMGAGTVTSPNWRLIERRSTGMLKLDEDLLHLFGITADTVAVDISDARLLRGPIENVTPFDRIDMSSLVFNRTPGSNAVDGLWGHHADWSPSNAFEKVGTLTAAIATDDTSFAVTPVGTSLDGSPSIQQFHLLLLGASVEDELVFVTNTNPETSKITVRRGINGTQAAITAWPLGTSVFVYRPHGDIVIAIQALAAYSYRRRFSVGKNEDRTLASSSGILLMPSKIPQEVSQFIARYRRSRIRVAGMVG